MLSSAYDKTKLFAEIFPKNSTLDDSGISLPAFPSRTKLKMYNILVIAKLVKKVVINLDFSKLSDTGFIPVMVLKNCDPELSYIPAELVNMCMREPCFPYYLKVSSVAPVFKNVGERSTAKNYRPVSLFSVANKILEKLVNSRLLYHLTKCGLFLIFNMVFRFPQ